MPVLHTLTRLDTVLDELDGRLRSGLSAAPTPLPTGFDPLDDYLGGGLRPGELILLGGQQGLGKTTMALQMAREAALGGARVLYVSYEHDPGTVLQRLLAIESAELGGDDAPGLREIRTALEAVGVEASLGQRLGDRPGGSEAVAQFAQYASSITVHRGGSDVGVATIEAAVESAREAARATLVVVDYVQKVAHGDPGVNEDERMVDVIGRLKELALDNEVPVVAITAADREGIAEGRRLRAQHLRGAAALAYEADVILLLNEKFDVVARHHLMYGGDNAERFRRFAVLSIEKNRGGLDDVHLEFRKRFEQGRYDRHGAVVAESLVDERVFTA